ncbi:eukaryotic translation initiation factor SUI1 family protein [Epithele typhae]|uniref:eukaryotic translation initiation factor SUI1 family protein n=1 Tax=Epithele typhae TaxID=378194 RepID=UPI0020077C13|nr:eukaryotic translation initiation factor SUI1 family protein [Epithele typhae]KAH9937863.1 eukaryotic translation initiation factor SUI1 family protein [Epithele typhae]
MLNPPLTHRPRSTQPAPFNFKKALKTKDPVLLQAHKLKKIRQQVLDAFPSISDAERETIVPDGLRSQTFKDRFGESGTLYLSSEGDPLWFTTGTGSEDLVPTVVEHPSDVSLEPGQLVAVSPFFRHAKNPAIAVGRMVVSSSTLNASKDRQVQTRQAVNIFHRRDDALWELGASASADPPRPRYHQRHSEVRVRTKRKCDPASSEGDKNNTEAPGLTATDEAQLSEDENTPPVRDLTPEDVSRYLTTALVHVIWTLKDAPASTFPILATIFWTSYVLPARPARALKRHGLSDASTINIKQSTYKTVKSFFKAAAKEGFIKIKESKGDVVITAKTALGVCSDHSVVLRRRSFVTLNEAEVGSKPEKASSSSKKPKVGSGVECTEFWEPLRLTTPIFASAENERSPAKFSMADIKAAVYEYVARHSLVNRLNDEYVDVCRDDLLKSIATEAGRHKIDYVHRDELVKCVRANMQAWHELRSDGVQPMPMSRKDRMRTHVAGFEMYGIDARGLADELRRVCASATAVSAGKEGEQAARGVEVTVQGSHIRAVTDALRARGIRVERIESTDLTQLVGK